MTERIEVNPQLLIWARDRSCRSEEYFQSKFPKLPSWIAGTAKPTFKQLEEYASGTYAPIGYFFLPKPPKEQLPITDYRTIGNKELARPSPNLLDTIYICQRRQGWYQDYARSLDLDKVAIVGKATTSSDSISTASDLQKLLEFTLEDRNGNWATVLDSLRKKIEKAGVLVMISSVVGSNTHRKLDHKEFRGFTLIDEFAPLIFINGDDSKAAQMFTIGHELAHVTLGKSGLDSVDISTRSEDLTEKWCNAVAAEFLLPQEVLQSEFRPATNLIDELDRLSNHFKVSTLVALRRIYDAGYLGLQEYQDAYKHALLRLSKYSEKKSSAGGGSYDAYFARVGRKFARAVICSTLAGDTLYRDAYSLLGFKKHSTFENCAKELNIL